jgi:hypothetical protein
VKKLLIFSLLFCFLATGCSSLKKESPTETVKSTRRVDFIMGCFSGTVNFVTAHRMLVPQDMIYKVCESMYDNHSQDINKFLDKVAKEGL